MTQLKSYYTLNIHEMLLRITGGKKGLKVIFESSETCPGLSQHNNDNLPQIKHQD